MPRVTSGADPSFPTMLSQRPLRAPSVAQVASPSLLLTRQPNGGAIAGSDAPDDIVEVVLPPGTPSWITPALIMFTLRHYRSRYDRSLTIGDAIEMLDGVGRLHEVLTNQI
jgi:hypothetical protein